MQSRKMRFLGYLSVFRKSQAVLAAPRPPGSSVSAYSEEAGVPLRSLRCFQQSSALISDPQGVGIMKLRLGGVLVKVLREIYSGMQ